MPYINVDEVYILDNTGLQVDMTTDLPFADAGLNEVQQAQARKNIAAGGTNPNLLDNPFFTVRQRGDGPFTSAGTTLDRWKIVNGCTATGTANGMRFQASQTYRSVRQVLETPSNYANGTYTVSINLADATAPNYLIVHDGNSAELMRAGIAAQTGIQSWTFTSGATGISAIIFDNLTLSTVDFTVRAVKLELGSVSTLANDAPPEYGTELLKCMRYFVRFNWRANSVIGYGYANSTTGVYAEIILPIPMRALPTITTTTALIARCQGTSANITSISCDAPRANHLRLSLGTSSMTTGYPVIIGTGSSDNTMDLSADL